MNYHDTKAQLVAYRGQIADIRHKMRALQAQVQPEQVSDYEFTVPHGKVRLSQLFGDKDTLFVIHNMGRSCPNCTMWADGFNGIYDHIVSRAAFVLSSPDLPEVQRAVALERGWKFPMVSHAGTRFAADMGYAPAAGMMPGLSVLKMRNGSIQRVADSRFNIGDEFCAIWRLFDMLPEGAAGWHAKFSYEV